MLVACLQFRCIFLSQLPSYYEQPLVFLFRGFSTIHIFQLHVWNTQNSHACCVYDLIHALALKYKFTKTALRAGGLGASSRILQTGKAFPAIDEIVKDSLIKLTSETAYALQGGDMNQKTFGRQDCMAKYVWITQFCWLFIFNCWKTRTHERYFSWMACKAFVVHERCHIAHHCR